MKILVHHRIASRDGQAVHLDELIEALCAQGHQIVLVGPELQKTTFGASNGFIAWIKKALPASVYEFLELAYNLPAFLRLDRTVRKHRPDFIYERFSLFLLAGALVRKLRKTPILLEVNGPLFEERAKNDGLALHGLARRCQGWLWRSVDYVLPVTGVLAQIMRRYGVPEERIVVIPNGIDPRRFSGIPETAACKAALALKARTVLGFTGFVREWHALDRVIDFMAARGRDLDLHFLIVGDGPAREKLTEYARAKGIADRLTFTGVVGRDAVARHVAAFDIAIQCGVTEYASPLKLFEYMYLARAIVAPATDNIREILTDGHDALLFNPERSEAMEDALLLLCRNDDLRIQLGTQARVTIDVKSLTWSRNAQRVAQLGHALQRANRCGPTLRSPENYAPSGSGKS